MIKLKITASAVVELLTPKTPAWELVEGLPEGVKLISVNVDDTGMVTYTFDDGIAEETIGRIKYIKPITISTITCT